MYITHISSEFSPFAKVGGLGDVLHGLSKQQVLDGHKVQVILPKYDIINLQVFSSLEMYIQDLWSYEDGVEYHNSVYRGMFEEIEILLIEPHHNSYYFNRGCIYGAINDAERFLYFCRTCIQLLNTRGATPEVLHLHDWPTAAVAPLIRCLSPKLSGSIRSIVFNIHNIEHQGKIHPKHLSRIGLNGAHFLTKDRMQDPIHLDLINLMKGAITYCDQVVTVSPTYAKEILTSEYGFGLHLTMIKFKDKLHGVLNGIETTTWNPSTDPYLYAKFPSNPTFINEIMEQKRINKEKLFKELGFHRELKGPLIVSVTRIVKQKGPELILRAMEKTVEKGGSFVLLGNISDISLEKKFFHFKQSHEHTGNVHLNFTYSEELAHRLYAAADAIIIPSKFEPCGLTQLISMRYGTVPIVRNTGGLKDTVTDILSSNLPPTGFVFNDATTDAIDKTLALVFAVYKNDQKKWQTLIQNGMNRDSSWSFPSHLYENIYLSKSVT